jgi:hypothetical protein
LAGDPHLDYCQRYRRALDAVSEPEMTLGLSGIYCTMVLSIPLDWLLQDAALHCRSIPTLNIGPRNRRQIAPASPQTDTNV